MLDPHCTATRKCWEHWQPDLRVSERAIGLAIALVHFHATTTRERLYEATCLLQNLLRRQWCEMTRLPFDFPSPRSSVVSRPKPTLSDLNF